MNSKKSYNKLLIVTQKMDENDDVLGFFTGWVEEFAHRFERVTVITLFRGTYTPPSNVRILSLGKESLQTTSQKLLATKFQYALRLYRYIWQYRHDYDVVFVHMNPRYVVYGGRLWRLLKKKVTLWYAHGHVNSMLDAAERLAHLVFTSTPEGFRLKSDKVRVVGQGIDTGTFVPVKSPARHASQLTGQAHHPDGLAGDPGGKFSIITVGRITESKGYETLVKAIELVKGVSVSIIGQEAKDADRAYREKIDKLIREKNLQDAMHFIGAVANKNLAPHLQDADLFVNTSHTGSLDKAILEAMSCGVPVITCNDAGRAILKDFNKLTFEQGDYETLAKRIEEIRNLSLEKRLDLGAQLRAIVVLDHALPRLIEKISDIIHA